MDFDYSTRKGGNNGGSVVGWLSNTTNTNEVYLRILFRPDELPPEDRHEIKRLFIEEFHKADKHGFVCLRM